jgi:hypothetical protein
MEAGGGKIKVQICHLNGTFDRSVNAQRFYRAIQFSTWASAPSQIGENIVAGLRAISVETDIYDPLQFSCFITFYILNDRNSSRALVVVSI